MPAVEFSEWCFLSLEADCILLFSHTGFLLILLKSFFMCGTSFSKNPISGGHSKQWEEAADREGGCRTEQRKKKEEVQWKGVQF